jgi:hypothetical protein
MSINEDFLEALEETESEEEIPAPPGYERRHQKLPLPRCLLTHKDEILTMLSKEKGYSYNLEKWLESLEANGEVAGDLCNIDATCQGEITREKIVDLAHKTCGCGQVWPEMRRLLLATMMWGWGNRGIGRVYIKLSMSDPQAKKVLEQSLKYIKEGQIRKAYDGFKLAGCGPAFFTKLFYFVGLAYEVKPLPVILDSQVAKSLDLIAGQEGWGLKTFVKVDGRDKRGRISSVGRYAEGYVGYVHLIDAWANDLGCSASSIEYYLYKLAGDKKSQFSGHELAKCRKIRSVDKLNDIAYAESTLASAPGRMPPRGALFKGEINDLSKETTDGWERRDITFYKREIRKGQIYRYPTAPARDNRDYIVLIDSIGNKYTCKFSKPEGKETICLGEPGNLKQWYIRSGYSLHHVNGIREDGFRDKVYFEYTGVDFESYIYTEGEFKAKYATSPPLVIP